eukprot:s50_g55.t1
MTSQEVRCPLLSNHPLFRVLRWEYSSTIRALLVSAIKQEPTRHMETIFTKGGVGHQMYFIEGRWLLYSTDTGLKNWLKICGMDFDIQTRSSPTHRFRNIIRGRRHFMAAQDEVLQRYELSLGTYLCEATLWVEKWLHHGDFVSTGHSKVVIVNSNAFAEAVAKHEDSKRLVGHYARHYVEMLRQHAEAGEAEIARTNKDHRKWHVVQQCLRDIVYEIARQKVFLILFFVFVVGFSHVTVDGGKFHVEEEGTPVTSFSKTALALAYQGHTSFDLLPA